MGISEVVKTWILIVLGLGIVSWIIIFSWAWYGNPVFQLLGMLVFFIIILCSLISLGFALSTWKKLNLFRFIPFGIFILLLFSFMLVRPFHAYIKELEFERNFQQYNQLIERVESGEMSISNERNRIPVPENYPAYIIYGQRFGNEEIIVEFLTGSGFPVKHWGYIYISDDKINENLKRRSWEIKKIKPHWYAFSD